MDGGFHIDGSPITWDNGNSRLKNKQEYTFTKDVKTGDVVCKTSSDERLKNNITQITGQLKN